MNYIQRDLYSINLIIRYKLGKKNVKGISGKRNIIMNIKENKLVKADYRGFNYEC